MNKALTFVALKGLSHLDKPVPLDLKALGESYGFLGIPDGLPIHPQTAHAINWHFPETFDDDDIAVFETTFFSKHL